MNVAPASPALPAAAAVAARRRAAPCARPRARGVATPLRVRWRRTVAAAAALLAAAVALPAQDHELEHRVGERVVCALRATVCAGANRAAGTGFVRCELTNLDTRAHELEFEIASSRQADVDVQLSRRAALGPQERIVLFAPLPRPLGTARLVLRVDGVEQVRDFALGRGAGVVGLLVSERAEAGPGAVALLQPLTEAGRQPELVSCAPLEAPADWRLYTGFHAVFVDGRERLPADLQEALRRFAHAGGRVVVGNAAALPAGALRQTVARAGRDGVAAHGLGAVIATADFDLANGDRGPDLAAVPAALPADAVLCLVQPIDALGRAPVAVFLSVILVFALLAGPVNFLLLRRWRRPLLAIATVPALGFTTTLLILGYGLLHDGFGVRGVVASWSWLDQERHEVAAIAARTLFAGRAPAGLAMGADALLLAPRAQARDRGAPDRWHFDGDAARLDGGALPSRTPTPLLTLQQGASRQRLVARRSGDVLHVSTEGGVAPIGTMVLRAPDGAWFAGEVPDLQRVDAETAGIHLAGLHARGGELTTAPAAEPRMGRRSRGPAEPFAPRPVGAVAARLFDPALAPGSYVAELAAAPWLDEHGLAVGYDVQRHYVAGRLAAEDFVQ